MKHSLHCWTMLLASVAMTTGCALPYESSHPHVAKFETSFQPATKVMPPAAMIQHPGPGVDGPGPGVMMPPGAPMMYGGGPEASQIGFKGNDGMKIFWDVGGHESFDSEPLVGPGRYNFPQGAIYRLKLTNIPGRAGVELYPTLEVGPVHAPRPKPSWLTTPFRSQFTPEDFDQVLSAATSSPR